MQKLLKSALIVLLAVLDIGCSSKAVKVRTVPEKVATRQPAAEAASLVPLSDRIDARAYGYYVNATLYEQMDEPYRAAQNYTRALKIYPDSYPIRYALAENLYRIQQFQEALETLNWISPEDADVFNLRGALYRAAGEEDSACAAYHNLLQFDSTSSAVYAYLAGVYRKRGDLDSVIWAYQHLVRLKPQNYRLWLELAQLQAQNGDYQAAKACFRSSIDQESGPTNVQSYVGLAELFELMKQPDSSIIVLKQALDIDNDNILIHRELSGIYIRLDSLRQAVPYVRKEVALAPLNRDSARRLAMLYFWIDSLRLADSVFTNLVDGGDRNPLNHSYMGRIALRRENLPRALEEFTKVTQLADSVYEGWLDVGFVYRSMQQPEKEIETYQTGLSRVHDEASQLRLLFALGAAYEQHGNFEESIATFEEIIARDPDYAQALNYLGYMLADRGERLDYAHELIERAVTLSPENAAYLDSYGWVFYRLGNYDEALVHLKKAVALNSDPVIFDHMGDVYRAVGDLRKAHVWWQKALELDPDNEQIKEKLGLGP